MREFQQAILGHAADQAGLPRRHFLRTLGLAVGGAALLGLEADPVWAQAPGPSTVEALQFALALEHLTAAFYEQAAPFLLAEANARFNNAAIPLLRINAILRTHEQTHEQALTAALRCAGAAPVARCQYPFSFADLRGYLQVAKTLEEIGVTAYHGLLPALIESPAILADVLKIATIEARHASLFRQLLGEPDPLLAIGTLTTCSGSFGNGAFDRAATTAEVKSAVEPLIRDTTCSPLKP